jgi:hypothetical protein
MGLNKIAWDFMLTNTVSLRVHISTEMKTFFLVKEGECQVYFSIIHPMKVPVQKIQFL